MAVTMIARHVGPAISARWRESLKQLTAPPRVSVPLPVSTAAHLPPVTRFRDPDLPYEDLIMCERDCMRCSYAATLDCDGNCGVCPRQNYCPCVNPAKVRTKQNRLAEMSSSRWWRRLDAIRDEAQRLARLVRDTSVRL